MGKWGLLRIFSAVVNAEETEPFTSRDIEGIRTHSSARYVLHRWVVSAIPCTLIPDPLFARHSTLAVVRRTLIPQSDARPRFSKHADLALICPRLSPPPRNAQLSQHSHNATILCEERRRRRLAVSREAVPSTRPINMARAVLMPSVKLRSTRDVTVPRDRRDVGMYLSIAMR